MAARRRSRENGADPREGAPIQTNAASAAEPRSFGQLLRSSRGARRLSQLELAIEAEVSQRHLSFLESGRALPSREMVLQLARALDLPLRERNRLLAAAGFAGIYPARQLEAVDMQSVRSALELMLAHHEPYPAVVVDRGWNLFMANAALSRVLGVIGDPDAMWQRVCGNGPRNLLRLTFHPDGLQPFIRNFDEVAASLLVRSAREALEHPAVRAVLDEVLRFPSVRARWRGGDLHLQANPPPVLATQFAVGGVTLALFSMMTTFSTPQDVTADELRVESFFPADPASEALLRQLGA